MDNIERINKALDLLDMYPTEYRDRIGEALDQLDILVTNRSVPLQEEKRYAKEDEGKERTESQDQEGH